MRDRLRVLSTSKEDTAQHPASSLYEAVKNLHTSGEDLCYANKQLSEQGNSRQWEVL